MIMISENLRRLLVENSGAPKRLRYRLFVVIDFVMKRSLVNQNLLPELNPDYFLEACYSL